MRKRRGTTAAQAGQRAKLTPELEANETNPHLTTRPPGTLEGFTLPFFAILLLLALSGAVMIACTWEMLIDGLHELRGDGDVAIYLGICIIGALDLAAMLLWYEPGFEELRELIWGWCVGWIW